MRPSLLAAVAAAMLSLVAAGPAAADSLVYTKDNNIWLAGPDGTGQYQVTTDGTADNPWQSPSQADDGTIVAARKKPNSGPLYRLRQNGDVLNQIPLEPMQFGPYDPAVSPDGATVAYTHSFARYVNHWLETGTDIRYARADGSGGTSQWPGVSTGATTPSWIDSGRTLVGRGTLAFTQQPSRAAAQWWSDYDHYNIFGVGGDLSDGEAAGGRVAMVRGGNQPGNSVVVYDAPQGTAATPAYNCTISDPVDGPLGAKLADPTLSADGRRMWVQQGDGIHRATMPGAQCEGWTIGLLIPGAGEPDWGPADVNPGPRTVPAPAPPAPGPAPAPAPVPPVGAKAPAGKATTEAGTKSKSTTSTAARCAKLAGKAKRARCARDQRRAKAKAKCKATKKGRALRSCLRKASHLR